MVRITWWLSLMMFWSQVAVAQFSNEWINYTQPYYKIPVTKDGIYRISYADLQAAGVPTNTIDPRRVNLYHRGTEQAITVQGQDDATFDPADFIEFYGQRNDGTLDADLYKPSTLQPHLYYNLYNDTSAYFLTWNSLPVPGKRMNSFSETNPGLPTESFHVEQQLRVYSTEYAGGFTLLGEIQSTAFDQGEGWTGPLICKGFSGCTGQHDLIIDNLLRRVTSGGLPQLELMLVGRDAVSHPVQIYVGADGGSLRLLSSTVFNNFEPLKINSALNWSDIGLDGRMVVSVRLTSASRDQLSVSYVKLNFPQAFDMASAGEKVLNVAMSAAPKSYIEINNPPGGARVWDISDTDNVVTIGAMAVGSGIGAVTFPGRKLYVSNAPLSATLKKVSFRAIQPSSSDYIIISHRSLMKPALGYSDAVQAYAAYRASATGGGYDTLTVAMDQLYNQFNYGEVSPRAIYQFMRFMTNGSHPKFLFLIGKGLEVSQGFFRKTLLTSLDFRDLVPSAGMPGADMAFTAGINGTTYEPAVPTGRLTASTPAQVAAYLNKIKETEALPFDDLWRKDILHLSGGIAAGEPEVFRQYVDSFKSIAESFYLGGKTETISKQTLNIELINVKDQVNKGLDLITFFGHSGPGTIDIDIGNVSDPTLGYGNAGKYPGFLINGCNAGRFFDNRVTFGEDWMLTANKGAKSFIAHSSFGFTNSLRQYSDLFYKVAFGDSTYLRKGVGEVQKEVGRRYLSLSGGNISSITQVQQMMLLGDPAVPLFGAGKPDYAVDDASILMTSIDGDPVTAKSDSFAIDVRVRNFGRAQPGPVDIRITRTLGDNSVIVYDSLVDPILYSDVIRFIIRRGRNNAELGTNNFTVSIDPLNKIRELSESNNNASANFFIPVNGTKNLFPEPYSIVHTSSLNLTFQNTDLLADSRSFSVEIDTAATFDSPYLSKRNVSGKVLAKSGITLLPTDSLVYYWRTRLANPLPDESTDWSTTSFVYIKNGVDGWAQVKTTQLSGNALSGMVIDPLTNWWKFKETVSSVSVKTYGSSNPASYSQVSLKINNEEFNVATQEQPCRNNTLNLIAFDKSSTSPYAGIPFSSFFDPRACGRAPQKINSFLSTELDTGNGDDIAQWVTNVQPNDSVVLFSIGDAGYVSWSSTVKAKLATLGLGSNQLNGIQPGEPFIIFGKKGSPAGSATVFRPTQSPANAQEVSVDKTITGNYSEGSITSVTIGPSQEWFQMHSDVTGASINDQYNIDLSGVDVTGRETILKNSGSGTVSISDIDAKKYPYVRLTLHARDEVARTPIQLRKWIVTFTPMAEGMLTYKGIKTQETVQEGETWKSSYGFANISSRSFTDSLTVQMDVFSTGQKSSQRKTFKIKPPAPGDTTKFPVTVSTLGKAGLNDVTVFVNPRVLPEVYYDNNVLPLGSHLDVKADDQAPLLEVTIDGRRVINGDVVSSSPIIIAKVIDNNPFILKTDTVGTNLFLQSPCGLPTCPYERINFSQPEIRWTPATTGNDFRVVYQPMLDVGAYSLKVEAVDGKGNRSGTVPYEVAFVVTDKKGFALQSVYPNPSDDKFYFRIFFSGPSLPDDFRLNLYSSTGSLVKTVGNEALGILHVGTNEVTLNANGNSGEALPDGIYMFRIVTTMDGAEFSKSGKLVVIRH